MGTICTKNSSASRTYLYHKVLTITNCSTLLFIMITTQCISLMAFHVSISRAVTNFSKRFHRISLEDAKGNKCLPLRFRHGVVYLIDQFVDSCQHFVLCDSRTVNGDFFNNTQSRSFNRAHGADFEVGVEGGGGGGG